MDFKTTYLYEAESQIIERLEAKATELSYDVQADRYAGEMNDEGTMKELIAKAQRKPIILVSFTGKRNIDPQPDAMSFKEEVSFEILACTYSARSESEVMRMGFSMLDLVEKALHGWSGLTFTDEQVNQYGATIATSAKSILNFPNFHAFRMPVTCQVYREIPC